MKPRIFISSTFYDLRQVREDLEQMIRDLGYESVRHETGAIPYAKKEPLENSAYGEVELCDILVSIIGGRYGTDSKEAPGSSISQQELRRALARRVQVYIFVERAVEAEYNTYLLNKALKGIKFHAVEDPRIYQFLEQVYALPHNNPVTVFETSSDITAFLKAQWAGRFQQLLKAEERKVELDVLSEMSTTAQTLNALVDALSKEKQGKDKVIDSIVLTDHPAFRRLAEVTGTRYRIFFTNRNEFHRWLGATGWKAIPKEQHDKDSVDEWVSTSDAKYLKITYQLFGTAGKLKYIPQADWQDDRIQVLDLPEAEVDEEPELDEQNEEPDPDEQNEEPDPDEQNEEPDPDEEPF